MSAKPVRFSKHALFEMRRRRIKRTEVIATVRGPGQVVPSIRGREIYQSKIGLAGRMLLRVVVKEDEESYQIITAYKTSNFSKYWSRS